MHNNKDKNRNLGNNVSSNQSNPAGGINYSQTLENLDRLYGESMQSQRSHKNKVRLAATGLALAAVTVVVMPVVIYINAKKTKDYYVEVASDAENFNRYSIVLKRGSTIANLKGKLNFFEGHKLIGVYKDEECTIPYTDDEKVKKNTVVYLKYEKEQYRISLPQNTVPYGYTIEYSTSVDPEAIEWGDPFSFRVVPIPGYHVDEVVVTANGSALTLQGGWYGISFVDQDIEIEVQNVAPIQYNIGNIPNGVIITKGNQSLTDNAIVNYGDTLVFSYIESEGHEKISFKVNGQEVAKNYSMTITEPISVEYVEQRIMYTVTLPEEKENDGYMLTGGVEQIAWGETFSFNVEVDEGYSAPQLKNNGTKLTPVQSYTKNNKTIYEYQIANVKSNITITIQDVEKIKYTVTFKDWDGSILKQETVEHGQYCEAPTGLVRASKDGYDYTFTGWDANINVPITGDATFTAQYEAKIQEFALSYTVQNCSISVIVYRDGKQISADPSKVNYGDVAKITTTPSEGYTQVSLNVTGATYDEQEQGYVVTGNVNIIATGVGLSQYTVTLVQGTGYTLSYADSTNGVIDYNGSCVVQITPMEGYEITGFAVDGVPKFEQNKYTYTLTNITHSPEVSATAKLMEYTLSNVPSQVTITRTNTRAEDAKTELTTGDTIYYWDELKISYTLTEGYEKTAFKINGQDIQNKTTTHVVKSEFNVVYTEEALGYDITLPQTMVGYTIDYTGKISGLTIHDSFTFTIQVEDGYDLKGVTINGQAVLTENSTYEYTISQIKGDVILNVQVEAIYHTISIPQSTYYQLKLVTAEGDKEIGESITLAHDETVEIKLVLTEGYTQCTPTVKLNDVTLSKNVNGNYIIKGTESGAIVVEGEFVLNQYTISVDVQGLTNDEYTIVFNGYTLGSKVSHGANGIMFTVNLAEKYSGCAVEVTGGTLSVFSGTYIINDVIDNVVIKLSSPIVKTYTVTEQSSGYLLVFEQSNIIEYGENAEFTIQLDDDYAGCVGYVVKMGDQVIQPNAQGIYVIENVTQNITVSVEDFEYELKFPTERNHYTISYDDGYGTDITLTEEDTFTFTITPHEGYTQDTIAVSLKQGSKATLTEIGTNQYTVTGVTGPVEILISEPEINTYTIIDTTENTEGYTLTIEKAIAEHGSDVTITFGLNEGYSNSSATIKINNETISLTDGTYTIQNVTEDKEILVEGVVINTYTVTFNNEGTAYNSQQIKHGEYAATPVNPTKPQEGIYYYVFTGWRVAGSETIVNIATYAIKGNVTFEAVYQQNQVENVLTASWFKLNVYRTGYLVTAGNIDELNSTSEIIIPAKHNNLPVVGTDDGAPPFRYLTSTLTTVIFEENDNFRSISQYAFENCGSLTNITIPPSVTKIGNSAFYGCTSLTDITIPSNVQEIGAYAFGGCSKLESVIFEENCRLTELGDGLFQNCTALTGITIPTSITSIGGIAFKECDSLTSLVIPAGVTSLGAYIIEGCDKLESVQFEAGSTLETIGQHSFAACSALKSINIPASVTTINPYAFDDFEHSSNLESITFEETRGWQIINRFLNSGGTVDFEVSSLKLADPSYAVELRNEDRWREWKRRDGVLTASWFEEYSTGYRIVKGDVSELTDINKIIIPSNFEGEPIVEIKHATAYENGVFSELRTSLNEVVFEMSDKFTDIGGYAFAGCSYLNDIIIPASVTTIWSSAFYIPTSDADVKGLKSVTFEEGSKLTRIYSSAFSGTQIAEINIPASVTKIEHFTFGDCVSLESVTFEENSQLTSIEDSAFSECTALTNIQLPESLISIGDLAFANCAALTSIYIPKNVESISSTAFANSGLAEIEVDDENATYDSRDNSNAIIHTNTNTLVKGTANTTISASVTAIGEFAFENNDELTSITISKNVTSIGLEAFHGCNNLINVIFEDGSQLTYIGESAFGYTNLSSITIPEGVTYIGERAFVGSKQNVQTAIFKNPYGWKAGETELSATDLSDSHTAGTYLAGEYISVAWTCDSMFLNYTQLDNSTVTITRDGTQLKDGDIIYYNDQLQIECTASEGYYIENLTVNGEIVADNPCTITVTGDITISYEVGEYTAVTLNVDGVDETAYLLEGTNLISGITEKTSYSDENTCGWYTEAELVNPVDSESLVTSGLTLYTRKATSGLVISDAEGVCIVAADQTIISSEVVIPKTYNGSPVVTIADSAFEGNTSITSMVIPTGVTAIGKYAFNGCRNLTSIKFVDDSQLESLGAVSFQNTGLASITIPSSVTSIGNYAFYSAGLTSITIPSSVISIGEYAFYSCPLTSVTFEANSQLTSIGASAFSSCEKLTSITIPASVTSIGNSAFSWCSALTSVTFEENSQLTSIGDTAFAYCESLNNITIPATVISIGERAFHQCYSLTSAIFENPIGWETYEQISSGDLANPSTAARYLYATHSDSIWTRTPPQVLSDSSWFELNADGLGYTVKRGSTTLSGDWAIPATYNDGTNGEHPVTAIADGNTSTSVFYDQSNTLTSLTIPSSITSIGAYAFFNCVKLTAVSFEANSQLTSIGAYAFWGRDITGITIPSSVTSIGDYAFYVCDSLTKVEFGANCQLTSIGAYAFYDCDGLTSITIPSSVTSIGINAFNQCDALTGVTFEANSQLTSLGSSIFEGCDKLTSITIPSSVTSIGTRAFHSCGGLTSIAIPASVTSIGAHAFTNCDSLTEITIPDSVTSIGAYAFYNCTNLSSVTFENTIGWKADTTVLSSTNLANTSTAATYLRSTYSNVTWTCAPL